MVTQIGADSTYAIGGAPSLRTFNLSTPAGWAMLYWGAAAFFIFLMLWLA